MTTTQRTNGANDAEVWGYTHYPKISDFYKQLRTFEYRSNEPELSFECKEAAVDWINKQKAIRGCMYNLYDKEILELLVGKNVELVVNYDERMGSDLARMQIAREWYPRITKDFPLGNSRQGVYVFSHEEDGYKRDMHHKFLVGWEEAPLSSNSSLTFTDYSTSLFYGSFNMSYNSPKSLDSVMIFRDNSKIMSEFIHLQRLIRSASAPWLLLQKKQFNYQEARTEFRELHSEYKEWMDWSKENKGEANMDWHRFNEYLKSRCYW